MKNSTIRPLLFCLLALSAPRAAEAREFAATPFQLEAEYTHIDTGARDLGELTGVIRLSDDAQFCFLEILGGKVDCKFVPTSTVYRIQFAETVLEPLLSQWIQSLKVPDEVKARWNALLPGAVLAADFRITRTSISFPGNFEPGNRYEFHLQDDVVPDGFNLVIRRHGRVQ